MTSSKSRRREGAEAGVARIDWADIVILDSQLPDIEGTAGVEHIEETQQDPFVIVVRGVEPGMEIINVPVDEYPTKPVPCDELTSTDRTMIQRRDCEDLLKDLFSLQARKRTLEGHRPRSELAANPECQRLLWTPEHRCSAVLAKLDQLEREWRAEVRETLADVSPSVESPS